MKRLLLCLSFFALTAHTGANAQNIQISMSPHPSPYVSDWETHAETLVLVVSNTTGNTMDVKVKTQLYNGNGDVIAETDLSKMPVLSIPSGISSYHAEDIYPESALKYDQSYRDRVVKTGRLPDDNYRLCVSLTDPKTGAALTTQPPQCRTFTITAYQAPILMSPVDKDTMTVAATKSLLFKWTPVVPRPTEPVTYRLQLFEILPGQDMMRAFMGNKPILEKDITAMTQTPWPPEFEGPQPGMSYVWSVQALDAQGRALVDNGGRAEPFSFSIKDDKAVPITDIQPKGNEKARNEVLTPTRGNEGVKEPTLTLLTPLLLKKGETRPLLQWVTTNPERGITYSIKVVELRARQSPEEALKTNPPLLEAKGIKETKLKYPSSATPLDTGKFYVWSVAAWRSGGLHLVAYQQGGFTARQAHQSQNSCNFSVYHGPAVQTCTGGGGTMPITISGSGSGFFYGLKDPGGAIVTNGYISGSSQTVIVPAPSGTGTYTYMIIVCDIVNTPNAPWFLMCFDSTPVTVNVMAPYTSTISQTQICRGQGVFLEVPNLSSAYLVNWEYSDGGPWLPVPGGPGNPKATNAISPACPAGSTYVTRYFRPVVSGWTANCFPSALSLQVWCPSSGGAITASPGISLCAGNGYPLPVTLSLTGNIGTVISWTRTGGGGGAITLATTPGATTITDQIPSSGDYSYTVSVQNGPTTGGCPAATAHITIHVEDPLVASLTGNKTEVCPNDDAEVYLSSQPPGTLISWQYQINCTGPWSSPTGITDTLQNTNSIGSLGPYPPPGPPTTSLCWQATVASPTGTCPPVTSAPYTISIIQPPCVPTIAANTNIPKCPGQPVTLTAATCATATGPLTWQWFLNGIPLAGDTLPSITDTTAGNYTVEVFNKNHCEHRISAPFTVSECINHITFQGPCNTDGTTGIHIKAIPNDEPHPPCSGPYTFLWSPGGQTTNTISVTPTATTAYSVAITDGQGCTTTAVYVVKVCP